MLTLDNFNLKGKRVFCRVDLNSPIDEKGNILPSERLRAHAKTVSELSEKGAKVILLAHQGKKGDPDFTSLAPHALLLEKETGKRVQFIPDVCGEKAKNAIENMKDGDILLLENVRYMDDETAYKTPEDYKKSALVKNLLPYCDLFVLDSLSVAHRPHASVIGFSSKPVAAGRVMERELNALNAVKAPKKPVVFILGGAKPEDSVGIMEYWLSEGKMDKALTCGVLGTLFLAAKGYNIGSSTMDYLKDSKALDSLPNAKELLSKYSDKIETPVDIAFELNGKRKELQVGQLPAPASIMDIGKKTAENYSSTIKSAGTVVINGPAGVYEKDSFSYGTKAILKAIEKSSAFSLAGGGHTISAIEKFKIDKSKISYISLAGKALIEYMSGEELPGIAMLEKAK